MNTSNGLTSRHDGVDKPNAPALVVVDKATGTLVAQEREGSAGGFSTASGPRRRLGTVNGRRLIFLGGGDGWCYAFEALREEPRGQRAGTEPGGGASQRRRETRASALRCVWRFDCDPTGPKENIHSYIRNRRESPSIIKSMPVFYDDRLFVTVGGDIWWGKQQAWLQCIDATGSGTPRPAACGGRIPSSGIASRLPRSTTAWPTWPTVPAKSIASISRPASLLGSRRRQRDRASALVADGKVYVGTRRGDFTSWPPARN